MPRNVWLLSLVSLLLAACASAGGSKLPSTEGAVAPVVQIVERIVYVPIDSALTGLEPIAEGPLSMCPKVAAERRAALERCNSKLTQIDQVEGTPKNEEPARK
jgi:hypothetical protein